MDWTDPVQVKAYYRAYYLVHRDEALAARKKWHAENRSTSLERMRVYQEKAGDKIRARQHARYSTNPDPVKEQSRLWRESNPDQVSIQNRRRGNQEQETRLASPWKGLIRGARGRARAKSVAFELDNDWGAQHWTGHCEVTGIAFGLGQRSSGPKFFSPSIDRIEPKVGYTKGNCRFVLWAVNAFKSEGTDADMMFVAEAMVRKMSAE